MSCITWAAVTVLSQRLALKRSATEGSWVCVGVRRSGPCKSVRFLGAAGATEDTCTVAPWRVSAGGGHAASAQDHLKQGLCFPPVNTPSADTVTRRDACRQTCLQACHRQLTPRCPHAEEVNTSHKCGEQTALLKSHFLFYFFFNIVCFATAVNMILIRPVLDIFVRLPSRKREQKKKSKKSS